MKVITRPPEGISLNGGMTEVLMDKDNKILKFETTEQGVVYLNSTLNLNYTEDEYWDELTISIDDEEMVCQ